MYRLRVVRKTQPLARVANALLATPAARHYGYELSRQTGVRAGVMYPILNRLLAAGWITDQWENEAEHAGPPRRYYLVTDTGRTELANYTEDAA